MTLNFFDEVTYVEIVISLGIMKNFNCNISFYLHFYKFVLIVFFIILANDHSGMTQCV